KTGKHLLGHAQHLVSITHRANLLGELDWVHDHSAGALQQRLDDNGRDSLAILFQGGTKRLNASDGAFTSSFTHGAASTIRGMDPMHRKTQVSERSREPGISAH